MDSLRRDLLRGLLPPSAAWAVLLLFAEEMDRFRHHAPPGDPWAAALPWAPPLAALLLCAALLIRRPTWLRSGPARSLAVVLGRCLLAACGALVVVTLVFVALARLLHDPGADPQGQFHAWVWLGGVLHAVALAPLLGVLGAGWWSRRRDFGVA